MEEICSRLGIADCIGSTIDPVTNKITRLNMRSAKVKSFKEKYPDVRIDAFYTDSEKNDRPFIEISETAYIVKGRKIKRIK